MREDMHKVIVERPRRGGDDGYNGMRKRQGPVEERPAKERMKANYGYGKQLNENLAPLRRFLESRVGRLWDKVYAEIREHFDASSAVKKHIFEHLKDYVYTHGDVQRRADGTLVHPSRYGRYETELTRGELYVDANGFLRQAPKLRRRSYQLKAQGLERRSVSPDRVLLKKDGVWFMLMLARMPQKKVVTPTTAIAVINGQYAVVNTTTMDYPEVFDAWHQGNVRPAKHFDLTGIYGVPGRYCKSFRVATSAEVKRGR